MYSIGFLVLVSSVVVVWICLLWVFVIGWYLGRLIFGGYMNGVVVCCVFFVMFMSMGLG